jgi:hypothetical protein
MTRWGRRIAALLAGAVVGALAMAGAAFAHVEISADNPQAGATNVVITFDAEAESDSAGISKVEVVLPAGIAPAEVTLKEAPSGWKLTATDKGYTVGGKALGVGKNAEHSVTVAKLPDAKSLTFKTLVTYSNGDIDRWIDAPGTDSPAPVLDLKPAAAPSPSTASPTAASTTADVITAAPATSAAAAPEESGGNNSVWWLIGIALVLGAVTAIVMSRRRKKADWTDPPADSGSDPASS